MLLGIVFWLIIGIAIGLCIFKTIEFHRFKYATNKFNLVNSNLNLLDTSIYFKDKYTHKLEEFKIVAVSHKGSLNIRRADDNSGKHAFWVNHKDVPNTIFFKE